MKNRFTNLWLPVIMFAGASASINAAGLPWLETFDAPDSFAAFSTINANGDKQEWEYNSTNQCVRVAFNDDMDMDDWLLTPPFRLEAGMTYKFSLDARNYVGAERLEVLAGMGKSVADMTVKVIEATDVKAMKYVTLSGEFTASASGEWFIGIHGCSPAGRLYLDVDNLSLNYGVNSTSPEALSDFAVTADADGYARVALSGTLPAVDVSGNPLPSVDRVEVVCDNTVLAVPGDFSPGKPFSWTHEDAPFGRHTYTVVAYCGNSRGREAVAEVFVGPNIPGTVRNPKVGELETGYVTLRWDCPDKDVDGNPVNPALVTYKVVRYEVMEGSLFYEVDIPGAEALTATEYVHRAVGPNDGQIYTAYGVYAQTVAGLSAVVKTPLFPVGESYETPFRESFEGGASTSIFRSETVKAYRETPSWDAFHDAATDVKSRDGDFGYLSMTGVNPDDCARFYSGKIALGSLARPALSFYVYNYGKGSSQEDLNTLDVYVSDGTRFVFQKGFVINELASAGWNKVIVPLDDFVGKTVQFAFEGVTKNYTATAVDCIVIDELADVDLEAVDVVVQGGKVAAGRSNAVAVRVENGGALAVSGYKVHLYRDGELVGTSDAAGELPSTGIATIVFEDNISVFTSGTVVYHAVVEAGNDGNNANDQTADVVVEVALPTYPVPAGLDGEVADGGVTLTWAAPDLTTSVPDAITDSFEAYTSFANTGAGGWIFTDADGKLAGKFTDIVFPGVNDNPAGAVTSFWVMDASADGINASFAARTGNKCLAQIYNADDSACDDWAISPLLYDGGQVVSFYAKSYSSYPTLAESFEVYYSEGGTELGDFRLLETVNDVPHNWTHYEFTLPDGASRFAIRCISVGRYMLMIDDVTYIPAEGGSSLSLVGYNVYRNGLRVNLLPVAVPLFADGQVPDGTHVYTVTALYDRGESLPSNEYVAAVSGLDDNSAALNQPTVSGGAGFIAVGGADGLPVVVASPDGKLVASFIGSAGCRVDVASGVYVVKVGNAFTVKVVVK